MASTPPTKPAIKVTRSAIRRAVASSTAIETGQSVKLLEWKLKSGTTHRTRHVKLADRAR